MDEVLTHDENAAPQEEPAVQPETQPAVESEFVPEQWKLNYKGQEIIPTDRTHLINLAQKGHSFEQRMEQLNNREKELSTQGEEMAKYKNFADMVQSNPKLQKEIWDLDARYRSGTPTEEGQTQSAVPPEILQEIDTLKQTQSKFIEQQEDYKLQQEMAQLKQQYKDHDWDVDNGDGTLMQRILKHSMDNNIGSLKSAYRDFHYDSIAAKAQNQALAQQAATTQAKHKAGIVQIGTPDKKAPDKLDISKLDYNDIDKLALKDLGG